jgi:hypothetical protein
VVAGFCEHLCFIAFLEHQNFLLPFCGERCGSLLLASHVSLSQRIIFVPFELLECVIIVIGIIYSSCKVFQS